MLKALPFSAANIRDSGLVVLHNGTTPHDSFPADLGSAATMNDIIASSVHFVVCFVGTEALSDVGHLVHSLYLSSLRNIRIVNQCCLYYKRVKQLLF